MGNDILDTSSRFDLNSVLNLQNQYAIDLSGISNDPSGNYYMDNLNNDLKDLNDTLQGSEVSSNTLILKQGTVNDILNKENQRLLDKKNNIDSALVGQQRLLQINDSYRKRQAAYIKVLIVIIVAIILFFVLSFLSTSLTFIPEVVYYLLFIILISGTIIYVVLMIYNINNRDPLNFDQLNLARPNLSPTLVPIEPTSTPTPKSGGSDTQKCTDISGNTTCVGAECCPVGSFFANGKCSLYDSYTPIIPETPISRIKIQYKNQSNTKITITQISIIDYTNNIGKKIDINNITTSSNNQAITSLINQINNIPYTIQDSEVITLELKEDVSINGLLVVFKTVNPPDTSTFENALIVSAMGTKNSSDYLKRIYIPSGQQNSIVYSY